MKNKTLIGFLVSAILAVGLVGCTTEPVPLKHDYGVVTSGDFTFMNQGVQTYSWHPSSEQAYLSKNYDKTEVTDIVRSAIENHLAKKGYQLASNGVHGDMVIGFGLAEESELSDQSILNKLNLSTGVPFYNEQGKKAEKGSLYVVFLLPNSAIIQWQALAQSGIQGGLTHSQLDQRISSFVDRLFRDIPNR